MEIKKAWETLKKDIAKEAGLKYGFTMTAKQIANRTATYLACNATPFEEEIKRAEAGDARVQGFSTWTDEEKARSHERALETIAQLRARMERFGTKRNQLAQEKELIKNSAAFAKFQNAVGTVRVEEEEANGCYYLRFWF